MTEIIFSPKAVEALLSQAAYLYQLTGDADKADSYLYEMESYISQTLLKYPEIGRPAPEYGTGVRKMVYKRYAILYRIGLTRIEILTLYKENLPSL